MQRRRAGQASGVRWTANHLLTLVLCLMPGLSTAQAAGPSIREQVEAEWQRQDACRVAEMRQAGLVRFVETELPWPGVQPDDRSRVPQGPPPVLDGRLDDPCWKQALHLAAAAPDLPSLWLSHDERRLYVGLSMPTHSEASFQGCSTALDAAGAVDGVKNGRYAFHTGHEPNPWWQVDLGTRQPIGRIVVYNRLDYQPGLHNADNLIILTSDDEKSWTPVYDNQGRHFGGVTGGGPLAVDFRKRSQEQGESEVRARFVRLQIRSATPIYFHLDEVEIYGPADPAKNVALRRPARQSSLSQWSRGGNQAGALVTLGKLQVRLEKDSPERVLVGGVAAPAERSSTSKGRRTSRSVGHARCCGSRGVRSGMPGKGRPRMKGGWLAGCTSWCGCILAMATG